MNNAPNESSKNEMADEKWAQSADAGTSLFGIIAESIKATKRAQIAKSN